MKGVIQLLFIAALFSACSDDDPTAPAGDGTATFTMQLSSATGSASKSAAAAKNAVFSITDLSGTVFTIDEARANVRNIQFDFPDGAADTLAEDKISIDGPFVINLITGISTPSISEFVIEPGLYKRIDVRLDDSKASDGLVDSSDALFENTLVVSGTFDYDNVTGRSYSIVLKFNEDVRFEEPGGIVIDEDALNDVVINLLVDEWLAGIDITSCLDDGDLVLDSEGNILIDDSSGGGNCKGIEGIIKTNIKNNFDLD